MSEIEAIYRYIKLTGVKYDVNTPYQMKMHDVVALLHISSEDVIKAIMLAFDYGRAKGERHARKELKAHE